MARKNELKIWTGGTVKALDVDSFFDFLKTVEGKGNESAVFKGLAYVYRAVLMRGNAITEIPWKILVGRREFKKWPPSLTDLFFTIECDLCVYGAAYVHIVDPEGKVELRRLNPSAMRAEVGDKGIKYFEFTTKSKGANVTKFKPEEIIYIRLYDPAQDLHPGVSPTTVALEAANLGMSANTFADSFFRHGAIPGIVLKSKGVVDEGERERATAFWDRLFSGAANKFRTAILSDDLDVKVIGAPPKDVAMDDLMNEVRKQIAVAFGIPEDMLTAGAANYATAQAHAKAFVQYTVIPEVKMIESAFNEQYLFKLGGYLTFETESTIVMSEDEAARAEAVNKYVLSGVPLATALAMLSIHVPEGYSIEPTAIPSTIGSQAAKGAGYEEALRLWEKKAAYRLKRGKPAFCTFFGPSIPWQIGIDIMEGLMEAETPEDITKVFDDQRGQV